MSYIYSNVQLRLRLKKFNLFYSVSLSGNKHMRLRKTTASLLLLETSWSSSSVISGIKLTLLSCDADVSVGLRNSETYRNIDRQILPRVTWNYSCAVRMFLVVVEKLLRSI